MNKVIKKQDCEKLGTTLNVPAEKIEQLFGLEPYPNDFIYDLLEKGFKNKDFESIKRLINLPPIYADGLGRITLEAINGFTNLLNEAIKNKDLEEIAKIEAFAPEGSEIKNQAYAELVKLCIKKLLALSKEENPHSMANLLAVKEIADYLHEGPMQSNTYRALKVVCEETFIERTTEILHDRTEDFSPLWEIYYLMEDKVFLKKICRLAKIKFSIPELEKVYKKLPLGNIKEKEYCLKAIFSIAKKQKNAIKILEVGQKTSNDSLREEVRTELVKLIQ